MNDPIEATQQAQANHPQQAGRPFICLSYAQSLDGSIAAQPGKPYPISGSASLDMTHKLRSLHDGLLIGIGTALADDPQLNVRLVQGKDPDPVVLDTQLRLPVNSRLLSTGSSAQIFCVEPIDADRSRLLSAAGAQIHAVPARDDGLLDLRAVLQRLQILQYRSIMVEGGAAVITQFLLERLVDWLVITIAPILLGGLRIPAPQPSEWLPVQLQLAGTAAYGTDQVLWGRPTWESG